MKYFIAFLAGAAVGALGVYLYFDKKIEDKVNAEMEKFFQRQEEMKVPDKIEPEENPEEEKVSLIPDTTEKTSIVEMKEIIRTQYRTDNDGIEEDEDFEDEEHITDEEMTSLLEESQRRMSEKPHIISEEERDLCRGYDYVEYTWYPESNLLVDTLDNVVDEPELIFGPIDWRASLKDKEEITIRDSHEATDYTIFNNDFIEK